MEILRNSTDLLHTRPHLTKEALNPDFVSVWAESHTQGRQEQREGILCVFQSLGTFLAWLSLPGFIQRDVSTQT